MFNLANLFTSANLLSGIASILLALTGNLEYAVYAIFAGAFFDFLDGFVARLMNTTGEIGKQLDSLADMVTFGVAPGVIMMVVLTFDVTIDFSPELAQKSTAEWINSVIDGHFSIVPIAGMIIPFFSLFRLAKFNLDTRQTTSFIGLPTPANTLFFMTFPLVLVSGVDTSDELTFLLFSPYVLVPLIIIMGVMMVSEIPLFSLKISFFKFKGNEVRFIFLLISLILILVFKVWAIALIVFLYLILSIIESTFLNNDKNEI